MPKEEPVKIALANLVLQVQVPPRWINATTDVAAMAAGIGGWRALRVIKAVVEVLQEMSKSRRIP